MHMMGLTVHFLWVPAHLGIIGNEMQNKIAKQATRKRHHVIDITVSMSTTEIRGMIIEKHLAKTVGEGKEREMLWNRGDNHNKTQIWKYRT